MGHSVNETIKYEFKSKLAISKNVLAVTNLDACVLEEDGDRCVFLRGSSRAVCFSLQIGKFCENEREIEFKKISLHTVITF